MLFVANSRVVLLLILSCLLLWLTESEAQAKITKGHCGTDYRKLYLPDTLHKAWASTGSIVQFSTLGGFACGGAGAYPTKAEAIAEAIKRCKHSRDSHQLRGKCRIIDAK